MESQHDLDWQSAASPHFSPRRRLRAANDNAAETKPHAALARLAAAAEAERATLAELALTPGAEALYGAGMARLADNAMRSLLHLAHGMPGPKRAAPLTAVALGAYADDACTPGAPLALLFLLDADPLREPEGERMAAKALAGFAELGFGVRAIVHTVAECAARVSGDPGFAARLARRRLVWGRHDLFARLAAAVPVPAPAPGRDAGET